VELLNIPLLVCSHQPLGDKGLRGCFFRCPPGFQDVPGHPGDNPRAGAKGFPALWPQFSFSSRGHLSIALGLLEWPFGPLFAPVPNSTRISQGQVPAHPLHCPPSFPLARPPHALPWGLARILATYLPLLCQSSRYYLPVLQLLLPSLQLALPVPPATLPVLQLLCPPPKLLLCPSLPAYFASSSPLRFGPSSSPPSPCAHLIRA